jgi:predicted permease
LQLTEAVVVAGVAAVPALLVSVGLTSLFHGRILPGLNAVEQIQIDWRVLGFTAAIALAAGGLSGLIPAVVGLRSDLVRRLRAGAASMSRGGGRVRDTLATVQLALSFALLVGTLLLAGTLRNLRSIDVGFDAEDVTAFTIRPVWSGYTREESQTLIREALAHIRSIPGVEEAGLSSHAPFSTSIGSRVRREGAAQGDSGIAATDVWVSPTYFRTMGIRLLVGRTFRDDEIFRSLVGEGERGVILTESLATRLFGDPDPIGQRVSTQLPGGPVWVVGIAEDSRWASLVHEGAGPILYHPLPSIAADGAAFLVRSKIPPGDLRRAVEDAMATLAPSVPVFDVAGLRQKIEHSLSEERLLAKMLTVFAVLAVVLAAVGLYAVIAFSVAERTRELGIRIALGARPEQILGMVVRGGVLLGSIGVVAGVAAAVALSRLIENRLYGLTPLEPGIYLAAAMPLFGLVVIASLLPARAATRVDPMVALRAE